MNHDHIISSYYKSNNKFPTPSQLAQLINKPEDEAKKSLKDFYTKSATPKKEITIHDIIRVALFVISAGAAIMSIYYSCLWFLERLPFLMALVSAVIMVGYGVLFPEVIADIGHKPVSYIIGFTGIVVILFSMMSTVAGQYNQRKVNLEASGASLRLSELRRQEKTLEGSIASLEAQIEAISQEESESKLYMMRITQEKLDANVEALGAVRLQILEEVDIQGKSRQDFYTWAGSVVGSSPDSFEFWMSLFPALFFDIIAPLGLLVALRKRD